MIKKFTITNPLNESVSIEMGCPEKSGFLIKDVSGLGPTKSDINLGNYATLDGAKFNSARANVRNIVFSLGFLDNPTIEHMRLQSYRYFPLKQKVRIEIETDSRICYTEGYVETVEPAIFTNSAGAVISILCPDPFLYDLRNTNVIFYGIENLLEFPLFFDEPLAFGLVQKNTEIVVPYDGDAPTGYEITVHVNSPTTMVKITDLRTNEFFGFNVQLFVGDMVKISSIVGAKKITLTRNGVDYNILNAILPNSKWMTLQIGDNVFGYVTDTVDSAIELSFDFKTRYVGV